MSRSVIEVLPSKDGQWFYHERYGSRIKNASQTYTRKSSAKRAGIREAFDQGSKCRIFDRDGNLQYMLDLAEIAADAELGR